MPEVEFECSCIEALEKILAGKMREIWESQAAGKMTVAAALLRSAPYERMGNVLNEIAEMEGCR